MGAKRTECPLPLSLDPVFSFLFPGPYFLAFPGAVFAEPPLREVTNMKGITFVSLLLLLCLPAYSKTKPKPTPPPASSNPGEAPAEGVYLNSSGSPLLPLLQSATQSIDIEIYTMSDTTVRSLLRSALARGVKVRILKDPHPDGQTCDPFGAASPDTSSDCADQQKLVSDVRAAGGLFEPFDKQTLCPNGGGNDGSGCYEHGKIAMVDGKTALISTGNFDDTNLCIDGTSQCDRDYTLITTESEVYDTLENIFEADSRATAYDVSTLIPSDLAETLTVSPISQQPILDFINSAQSSVEVETQYLEDPDMNAALEAAAKRGVNVSVTVASVCAFGKPSASDASDFSQTYTAFDSAGISSAMFNSSNLINGKKGYLHAKAIIVDGSRAWLGSENGSAESLTENREYGMVFDDADWVASLKQIVDADHSSPDSETWQQSLACQKDKEGVSGD